MLQPKVHLCLVYNTAISNITPALAPEFKPEEVILLHTEAQNNRAENLEAVLKPTGVKVSHWLINDLRDIEHIRERVLDLLVEREDDDIALNASGGTRPMSMAAYEIFTEFQKPIFYVNPDTDDVIWLHTRELTSFNCPDRLKLPAFLRAHGAKVTRETERKAIPKNLRELTKVLVNHVEELAKPLSALNWLAQQADDSLVSPPLSESQRHWVALQALIQRFEEEEIFTYRNNRLHFESETTRFFANGGWLEEHVFSLIYGLRRDISTIQDVGRGVELVREESGRPVKNELDVAFLSNNHMFIIECKTKQFGHVDHEDAPGAETLYKLDTLKGLFDASHTKGMLISFQELSKWDIQRAHDLNIQLCTGKQLQRLESVLRHWITNT